MPKHLYRPDICFLPDTVYLPLQKCHSSDNAERLIGIVVVGAASQLDRRTVRQARPAAGALWASIQFGLRRVRSMMEAHPEADSDMASSDKHTAGQASPQPISCGSAASLSAVSDTSELQLELDDGQLERMQAAVKALLVALGEDVQRQGLRNTPKVRSIRTTNSAWPAVGFDCCT